MAKNVDLSLGGSKDIQITAVVLIIFDDFAYQFDSQEET